MSVPFNILHSFLQEHQIPGATAALLRNGELEFMGAAGCEDLQGQSPLDPQAIFPIFSVTKTLIAALVLKLARAGTFTLDDAMQMHFPELEPLPAFTFRQVLMHTSGLVDYGALAGYHAALRTQPLKPWSDAEHLQLALSRRLLFEPGTGFAYSNIGYMLLKQWIESQARETFASACKTHLFDPLGLKSTFVLESLEDMQTLTPGFSDLWNGEMQDLRSSYPPQWVAHGLVASSARELALLIDALFTAQLLTPLELGAMQNGFVVAEHHPIFEVPAYGLGLMLDGLRHAVMGHGGGGPGYSIGALHWPDQHGDSLTCVTMLNRDGDWGLELSHQLGSSV
ncbi:serine hydrolase domain-containing protein [Deinococcus misasensis]|uniref:serine hydrolase domain-containing protein n=1 Tax=Deinococcus misasensis TaxID=392413 RepID=UPI00068C580F|nr:serine hydrolase domain-containing protein [Deinococcus misasensis]